MNAPVGSANPNPWADGGRGQLAVDQVGHLVEPGLLLGGEEGGGVAVLAHEDPRVADHDDLRRRRQAADRAVETVDAAGQRAVDVALRAVDRAVAVAGPRREGALGEDVREAGVVAADRDRDQRRTAVEGAELGVGDVRDGRPRAGPEVERVAALRREQAGVGERRALALGPVVDVAAGADARGVGVAERDVGLTRRLGGWAARERDAQRRGEREEGGGEPPEGRAVQWHVVSRDVTRPPRCGLLHPSPR